jgi:hypothetical protein
MVRRLSTDRSKEIAATLWTENAQSNFGESINGKELIESQEKLAKEYENKQIKSDLEEITNSIRDSIKSTTLSDLPTQVGGQYNQREEIHLNQNLFNFTKQIPGQSVSGTIEETTAKINHIYNHEAQHAEHRDHKPMQFLGQTPTLILGGETFSPVELIEGANMSVTGTHSSQGKQVVSLDYMRMHKKFQRAVARSNYNHTEILTAVKDRDVTLIDDRANFLNQASA